MTAVKPNQTQIAVINAILSIFETGTVKGRYASVVFAEGDKGELTYGKHQTTLASGNLAKLVAKYVAAPGAVFAAELTRYVPDLQARLHQLNFDRYLKNLLRAAADDSTMRRVQDDFFSEEYQKPAFEDGDKMGLRDALSYCIRYDGQVHGSWGKIAKETDAEVGKIAEAGERTWVSTYVALRRQFLANGPGLLPKTVYRMDAFRGLIKMGAFDLALPLIVRDVEINSATLDAPPGDVFDGPAVGSREIKVASPAMRGLDVRRVQLALSRPGVGFDVDADGAFGKMSDFHVKNFQVSRGLTATGVVDSSTLDALRP
jgi:chitosanase